MVQRYKLEPQRHQRAIAAVERYKVRVRLGDSQRSELLDRMAGILSDEERDNFRAALERRPVVATGTNLVFRVKELIVPPPAFAPDIDKGIIAIPSPPASAPVPKVVRVDEASFAIVR